MTAAGRQERASAADAMCAAAFARAAPTSGSDGMALVAVGGYGRRELAPYSDLDVVLVHADDVDVTDIAQTIWYPLWDAGAAVDHSVRALSDVTAAARQDLRVALGLLDLRHVAGDPSLTLQLRTSLLTQWRRDVRRRIPELRELTHARQERWGELAHAAVPDLKESAGGLRDATVLNALVAAWLVDVPHGDLERCRRRLLDVRDVLHDAVGRPSDRVAPELWDDLAQGLDLPDAEVAQQHVRGIGRRLTHLSRLTWRRVEAALEPVPRAGRTRAPSLTRLAPGVAVADREVVLDRGARPSLDPSLLLRAAAEAAERDLVLSPSTAARLAREGAHLPDRWDAQLRTLFVRLLAAGPGLLQVWETLDETGALERVLPEWHRVRLLPHALTVHRFTVDRHLVETCIEASRLIRRVRRPDVLMVAALLHDIGKGGHLDHSVAGEPLAGQIAARMGFSAHEVTVVERLVRWHLLLSETAVTRDLEDPATIEYVASRVADLETLELLDTLTEADARATSPQAWTAWRAGLVADLVRRLRLHLRDGAAPDLDGSLGAVSIPVPAAVRADPARVDVRLEGLSHGSRLTVVSGDRVGLMAAVAGALAVLRVSVRSARAWGQDDFAWSVWELDDPDLDEAIVRQRLEAVIDGRLDPGRRLPARQGNGLEPSVQVRPELSDGATVLEVRVDDRPGVVFRVCETLAALALSVRSAHVATVGPQAVDVFYVQETGAGALADDRAAAAVHAVRQAFAPPVTLDA